MNQHPEKILDYKTYNKIGHLSKSRLGKGDHFIDKKAEETFLKQVLDNQTLVIVQEKMDGSNVCVVKHNGDLIALGRSGYKCSDSNLEQHRYFDKFVKRYKERFSSILPNEGDRIVGEWCLQAHGTKYPFTKEEELFYPFDIFLQKTHRLSFIDFFMLVSSVDFRSPKVLHLGGSCSINRGMKLLKKEISLKAHEYDPEGLIYRIEKAGAFQNIAKYVCHHKEDGKYFKDGTIWNIDLKEVGYENV